MDKKTFRRLTNEIAELCEDWIDSETPAWTKPMAFLDGGRPAIYISLAEEDEYKKSVPWQEFEDSIMRDDAENLNKYLPLFKRLVSKMESRLKEP